MKSLIKYFQTEVANMNVLDRVLAGVKDHPNIAGSTTQMLHNLAEQVRATATNPTAVDQMADMIHEHAADITAAILYNTPTTVVTIHPDHAEAVAAKTDPGMAHPDSVAPTP